MGDMEPLNLALKEKISKGCNQNFHFLENLDDESSFVQLLVGFVNATGGEIMVGVKQNGKVAGVNPSEIIDTIYDIIKVYKIIKDTFSTETIILGRHALVQIKIKTISKKLWLIENGEKASYIRVNASTCKVNKIVKKTWVLEENEINIEFSDLREQILDLFTKKSELSLSYIYKDMKLQNSKIDNAVSELLYRKKIRLITPEGKLMYSIVD